MKKAIAFVCGMMLLLSLTACGSADTEPTTTIKRTESTTVGSTTTTQEESTTTTTATTSDEVDEPPVQEVLAQDVEADTIRYYKGSENYHFCVITKDGKSGIIDYAGNILVPMQHDIWLMTVGPYSEEIKLCVFDEYPSVLWIEADGTTVPGECDGWGFECGEDVIWYNDEALIVDMFYPGDNNQKYSYELYCEFIAGYVMFGDDFVSYDMPSVIPIQEASALGEEVTYASDKYALFDLKSGKLLTGFIYENYYLGYVNGLMAVKRDGKWGYVRENGTVVTGFVYDAAEGDEGERRLYTPINGYIAVCQRGKWGIIDTDGKVVVTPQYEDITQVDDQGRYWCKRDGLWSAKKMDM